MAGIKISNLPAVTSALSTDIFPVVQAGVTSKETVAQLLALVPGGAGTWNDVTGPTATMTPNNGYITDDGAVLVTLTLPATAALGTTLAIQGKGSGKWTIAQNAGQNIQIGGSSSTVGAGGSVSAANQWDSLLLVCVTANTTWAALGAPMSAGLVIV